jgi:hypothetical protein
MELKNIVLKHLTNKGLQFKFSLMLLLLILAVFSSFSLCSESVDYIQPIFRNVTFDENFIKLIKESNTNPCAHCLHDPKVFGEHTLVSIFNTLFKKVQQFSRSHSSYKDREAFDSMVIQNYYPLIENFRLGDTKRFIQCLFESTNTYFQLHTQYVVVKKSDPGCFTSLIHIIIGVVGQYEGLDHEKQSFQSISSKFTLMSLEMLFERPVISQQDWRELSESFYFYFRFKASMISFYDPKVSSSSIYLPDEFSLFNGNEINFLTFQDIHEDIRKSREGNPQNFPVWKTKLFALFSTYLHESPGFIIRNISQYKIRFLCSILILKGEKDYHRIRQESSNPLENLVSGAIKTIESDFKESHTKFPALSQFLQPGDFQPASKGKINDFLEKYINGEYDKFDFSKHQSIWMIQIYLHLLKYKDMIFKASPLKNSKMLFQSQPELLISADTPADHIFIKLIESFQPLSPRIDFVKSENDPIVFGKNTLVSIFNDLIDIVQLFGAFRLYNNPTFLNNLISTFYNPLLVQLYNSKPMVLLQLACASKFSFQYYVIEILNCQKLSFTLFIRNLKTIKRKVHHYDVCDIIQDIKKCTQSKVENLLRKPIASLTDWEERKALIVLFLDILLNAKLQLDDDNRWSDLKTSISKELEKYKFLLDNFSIVDDWQFDFQIFQKYYEKLFDTNFKNEHLALLSLHSFHFLNSSDDLPNIRFKSLCYCAILKGEIDLIKLAKLLSLNDKELVIEALRTIEFEICVNLTKAFPNCNLLKSYFRRSKISYLSIQARNILRNYAEKTIDMGNIDWGVGKRMIKVYLLLLLQYEKLYQII